MKTEPQIRTTCEKATDEVTNHRDGVEECELFEGHEALVLKDHTNGATDCHVDGVAERDAGEQPHDLLVKARDRDSVKTCCDTVERGLHSVVRSHIYRLPFSYMSS